MPPKWTENLEQLVKESRCRSEVLRKIGLSPKASGNHQTFDRWVGKLGIDTSHFDYRDVIREQLLHRNPSFKRRLQFEDIFCENSLVGQTLLRKRFKELATPSCTECSVVDSYNGKPIVLQLDHINGIRNDNRLENLRWLCPNCHSQTNTWSNKSRTIKPIFNRVDNIRNSDSYKQFKIDWPDVASLRVDVEERGYEAVGKALGVSGNAVKKHLLRNNVQLPKYNISS